MATLITAAKETRRKVAHEWTQIDRTLDNTPGCLPARRQNQFTMTPLRQINALHCVIAGFYLSSICNNTALPFL